jgi:hypothetical protein
VPGEGDRGAECTVPPPPLEAPIPAQVHSRRATRAAPPYAAAAALLSCHGVRIRGPSRVMAIVNSKWAASEPSCE